MIECGICEGHFHPDEISNCPKCGIEICERCFEKHVNCCGEDIHMDEDEYEENDEIANLPRECPKCGAELELDTGYDETTLLCPECDYQLDVTAEFQKLEDIDD